MEKAKQLKGAWGILRYCDKQTDGETEMKKYQISFLGKTIWLDEDPKDSACKTCGTDKDLLLHHTDYDLNDPLAHTETLCRSCHQTLHSSKGYGNIGVSVRKTTLIKYLENVRRQLIHLDDTPNYKKGIEVMILAFCARFDLKLETLPARLCSECDTPLERDDTNCSTCGLSVEPPIRLEPPDKNGKFWKLSTDLEDLEDNR